MIGQTMTDEESFDILFSLIPALDQSQTLRIRENTRITHIQKGRYIYNMGDTPAGFIFLLSGSVKVFQGGVTGRDQIIRMVSRGGIIGYRALFAGEIYTSFAQAIEDSMIAIIDKEAISSVIRENGELGLHLIRTIAIELGISNKRTISLTQKHIRGRLAESLLSLIATYGYCEDGKTLNISLSREELAELSSMTTANAIRTLSSFANEGVIELDLKKIMIEDFDRLVKISELG